jgi:purine-binding chemotaxis protein CheW
MQNTEQQYVLFTSAEQQFALPLDSVERVLQVVSIRSLSKVPDFILGVMILEGDPVPVCSLRRIFNLETKDFDLSDQFIVVNTRSGRVALWVDMVLETIELESASIAPPGKLFLDISYIDGVTQINDSVVLISDPDRFLEKGQMESLRKAMEEASKSTSPTPVKKRVKVRKSIIKVQGSTIS